MAKRPKRKTKNISVPGHSRVHLFPVVAILIVVPLVVYGRLLELDAVEFENWDGTTTHLDLMSYYRGVLFILLTTLSLLATIYLAWVKRVPLKNSRYYGPIGVYLLFVALSYAFSEYRETAALGFVGQRQGVWVLLCYGLVIATTFNLIRREKDVGMLLAGCLISMAIVVLVGTAQFFGFDVFQTGFGKRLILPAEFHHLTERLKFTFVEFNVNATFHNSNYTGSYAVLVFPLVFALYLRARKRKKLAYAALAALTLVIWFGSNSRAAYVSLLCTLALLVFLFRAELRSHKQKALALTMLLVATFLVTNGVSGGKIANRFASMDLRKVIDIDEHRLWFESISVDGNEIYVNAGDQVLIVRYENRRLFVSHFADEEVYFTRSAYLVRPTYLNFQGVNYALHPQQNLLEFVMAGKVLRFTLIDGQFKAITRSNQSYTVVTPERIVLADRREKVASARAYIWSRAIPLLKDTLLLGFGPDLFVAYFPKGDIAGKLNAYDRSDLIVTKPHNLYLQIALNTGVVSLLAFVVLYGFYIAESLRLYANRNAGSQVDHVGIGIFVGIVAYLLTGLFNDQTISVAPTFYVLTGVGIAINEFVRKGIAGRAQGSTERTDRRSSLT